VAALRGAFINLGAGLLGALPNIIVFQFNPVQMSRTPSLIDAHPRNDGAGRRNARWAPGQPSETLSFTLRVDATDQLASGSALAIAGGIVPTLSALELLMVPRNALSINLVSAGTPAPHRHPPEMLPVVLFVWGPLRVLPVKVTSLSITETEFDTRLNPVRADVTVNLDVLTPDDMADDSIGRGAYTYSRGVKEAMAALNLTNAMEIGVSGSVSFVL
jgi:hypothetical protein